MSKISKSSKISSRVILQIIIVLLVLGGLYYWVGPKLISSILPPSFSLVSSLTPAPSVSPTPDVTATWQTYTDPSNTFSFKYPATIGKDTLYVSSKAPGVKITNYRGVALPLIPGRRMITITVLPLATNQTVSSYLTSLISQKRNAKTIQHTKLILGSLTGEEVTGLNKTLPTQVNQLDIFLSKGNGKMIQITLNPYDMKNQQNNAWAQTFLQMLPTFKIL